MAARAGDQLLVEVTAGIARLRGERSANLDEVNAARFRAGAKWAANHASYTDLKVVLLVEERQNGGRRYVRGMAADLDQWHDTLPDLEECAKRKSDDLEEYLGAVEDGVLDLWSRIESEVDK